MKRRLTHKHGWQARYSRLFWRAVQAISDAFFLARGRGHYKVGGYYRPPSEFDGFEKVEWDNRVRRIAKRNINQLRDAAQEGRELEQYLYGDMITFSEDKDDHKRT